MSRRTMRLWLSLDVWLGMTLIINSEAVAKIGSSMCHVCVVCVCAYSHAQTRQVYVINGGSGIREKG